MYSKILEEIKEQAYLSSRKLDDITLVAVSKSRPIEAINSLIKDGCKDFGESRVQEILVKMQALPLDLRWHFIGTLQKNKVSKIVDKTFLIHSVDSFELLEKISQKASRKNSVLLQVNTSFETTKHGLYAEEWEKVLPKVLKLPNLSIQGLMTMAPLTEDKDKVRDSFKNLRELKDKWQSLYFDHKEFFHLSMGMSQDFKIAIQEGATLLRIGSALFDY
jgi:pyridoxal phosphate enzyme (YggS family)